MKFGKNYNVATTFFTGTSSYGDDRTSSYDGAGKSRKSPFDKFRQMEQSEESSKSNISQR